MKTHQRTTYTIYLLTVWWETNEDVSDPSRWRFRLENPQTKERRGVEGLDELITTLAEVIRSRQSTFAKSAAKPYNLDG